MKHLRKLNLSNNKYLKDYTLLEKMKELKHLDISYNEPADFAFLTQLDGLTHLSLCQTRFSDLTLLKNMKDLEYLDVSNNRIIHEKSLSKHEHLKSFIARGCQLKNIDFLHHCTKMKELNVFNNQISDITVVKNFKEL